MRKIFLIAAFIFAALTTQAQRNADIEVGAAVQYAFAPQTLKHNVGGGITIQKPVTDRLSIRAIGEVNGFVPNGFDRYGCATLGVTFAMRPIYVLADAGINFNPSSAVKSGFTVDVGLGYRWNIGTRHAVTTEAAWVKSENGGIWQDNAILRFGYLFTFKHD